MAKCSTLQTRLQMEKKAVTKYQEQLKVAKSDLEQQVRGTRKYKALMVNLL